MISEDTLSNPKMAADLGPSFRRPKHHFSFALRAVFPFVSKNRSDKQAVCLRSRDFHFFRFASPRPIFRGRQERIVPAVVQC